MMIATSRTFVQFFFLILVSLAAASAQSLPSAPAPTKPTAPPNGAYKGYAYEFGLVCGAGDSYSSPTTKPTAQCGGIATMPFFELEAGVMGPQASHSSVSGYLTANAWAPITFGDHGTALITGGYTRMFETGNAFDYGVGYAIPIDSTHSLRFDARDYWTFSNPSQHNVVLRVAWMVGVPD